MSALARFHASDADELDPCWFPVGIAAAKALVVHAQNAGRRPCFVVEKHALAASTSESMAADSERRKNPPENTDTVAEDRLAMREIEGGCADEDDA